MMLFRSCLRLVLTVCICSCFWYCREKPVPDKEILDEPIVENINPKVIVELCTSAGVSITDTTDIDPLLRFKMIDSSGAVQDIDIDEAAQLFKRLKSWKKNLEIPLMEFQTTDKTLMMINGRGYGGPIRATLILNNKTLELDLVQIEHRAESEGYGSGITMNSFEEQFIGIEMEQGTTPFGLKIGDLISVEGKHKVEGISGATVTCQGVVNMFNQNIQKYTSSLVNK